jgi:hypothetical protein
VSEELDATVTLRGSSRESVEAGASVVESFGYGASLAQSLAPVPDSFLSPDGSFEGPADWFYENWGCKGFDLKEGMWREETAPGDENNQWWACWNLLAVNGVPKPILKALSDRLPELEIGFFFEEYVGGDEMFRGHEVIWENGILTEDDE